MRVEDIMTRVVFTCDTRATLEGIAQVMWDHDCGCVPIVNWANTLMGLVTDRDLAMAAYTQGKRLSDIPVRDIMSRRVNACETGVSVEIAHQIMRNAKIRRLPVVDHAGKLVGLVTWSDMYAASQRESAAPVAEAMAGDVIETLDMSSAHHR
jgi:predicted transcriptional regulator